jgi:hypothetical protein
MSSTDNLSELVKKLDEECETRYHYNLALLQVFLKGLPLLVSPLTNESTH